MEIVRRCPFTGKVKKMDLPITEGQISRWESGVLIQDAFPNLDADQREFIKTGITPEVWDAMFAGEDI